MKKIAILAYGSLIDEPGEELENCIVNRLGPILTPFKVEYARSSRTRGGAPTLVPVDRSTPAIHLPEMSEAQKRRFSAHYEHPQTPSHAVRNTGVSPCRDSRCRRVSVGFSSPWYGASFRPTFSRIRKTTTAVDLCTWPWTQGLAGSCGLLGSGGTRTSGDDKKGIRLCRGRCRE